MARFGKRSQERLQTLRPEMVEVLKEVIKVYDFSVLETTRDKETQDRYFKEGKSKLKFPKSKHNRYPSDAVDIAPYPIEWHDLNRFFYLAGLIISTGYSMGINIRWGGDWNSNGDFTDQTFNDLPHFEYRGRIKGD